MVEKRSFFLYCFYKFMVALGIETSHEQGSVGLAHDGTLLGELLFTTGLGPGEQLLPAIDSLLTLNGIERRQIDLISVALGPGSFTSLRIGLAAGKGLAQALHSLLVGIASSVAYAEKVSFWPNKICVVLPDRRDLVYRAFYERGRQIEPEASRTIESLRTELSRMHDALLCIGPGAERHRAILESVATVAPTALNQPSGAVIAQLGLERFSVTHQDELWTLEPLYVQRLVAEMTSS